MSGIAAFRGLSLTHPAALWLLIGVAIVLVWSLVGIDARRKAFAPLIRALMLALLVLALAGPEQVMKTEGATDPVIVDVSASITPSMRTWTAQLLRDQLKLRAADPAIAFGAKPVSSTVEDVTAELANSGGCAPCEPRATDIEAALSKLALDPDTSGGQAVLITDGWENRGDAERALAALRASAIRVFVFTPPTGGAIPNVALTNLSLPRALAKAAPFALGVTAANFNDVPAAGTISIYQNERLIEQRPVTLAPGQQRIDFPVRTEDVGLTSYRAVFKASNPALDQYPDDDALEGWVGIGARRRVLILTGNSKDAGYLETAVRRLGLEPNVIALDGKVFSGSLNGYDAVLLNNVSKSQIAPESVSALASYVEHGGSLAMIGGDRSFGLGGWQDSELAGVMPVVMKPPQHQERKRALVLIIDKSGSMGRDNKLVFAKAAARTVAKTLNDDDLVSVIGFDSQAFVVIPLGPFKDSRERFNDMVDLLKARGTTVLLPALKEAEREIAASNAAIKHVVILTDGKVGATAAMYYDLVSTMHREGGATVSTVGIGRDADVPLLRAIANYGGGAFYQTDSAQSLPDIFLEDVKQHGGELTMVEKDFAPHTISPDSVLKELAGRQLPTIKGYVSTDLKPAAALDAFVDRQGKREPLIASWKYRAGKALAITTDGGARWASQWIGNNAFAEVWDKLFDWMAPQAGNAPQFDVALGYRDGRLEIKLTDYSEQPGHSAHLLTAAVARPDGVRTQAVLSETTAGELSGSVEAPKAGTYYIELKSTDKDRSLPPLAYTVSPAALAELPRPAPNYGLLERLASATGGRLNPSPDEIVLARPITEHSVLLAPYLVVAAMLLLIGEALVRRLTY